MPTDDHSLAAASDLSFRPASYFHPQRLKDRITSKIAGHVRRRLVKEALATGEAVPPALLQGTLDDTTLGAVTRIHLALLGGEFLPEQEAGEVEIARAHASSGLPVVQASQALLALVNWGLLALVVVLFGLVGLDHHVRVLGERRRHLRVLEERRRAEEQAETAALAAEIQKKAG
jgi:hypothetical protein